ncbi:MAG: hypothetical protein QOJ39_3677 [Candidatus Eremiobacteraeota bacterium]|jgi:acyl dehydratase|nr:hypothetical protein [Candidatus Eremiobacteraeota bacterium]
MFFEDAVVGARYELGTVVPAEESIVRFATEFDPQPMHADPAAAAQLRYGGVIASGWHTAALTMRLMVDAGVLCGDDAIGMAADEVRWYRPVHAGDALSLTVEIVGVRPPREQGRRGRVDARVQFRGADGTLTFSMKLAVALALRSTADV